jgi:phosphoribosylanthranilate isomerase
MAVAHGASAIGLVSQMPSGQGIIDDATCRTIAACVPPGVETVLLTSATDPARIIAQQRDIGASAIQLVDWLDARARLEIRDELPGVSLIQVVHVEDEIAIDQARAGAVNADALLLDSGRPGAPTPELGGTGRAHDWRISRQIVAGVDLPVWLAGGLNPSNVAQAIAEVQPFGVDICSGLRDSDGSLIAAQIAGFFAAVDKSIRPVN